MGSTRISIFVCVALAAVSLRGQVYWSSTQPDCSNINLQSFSNPEGGGATVYSCSVYGTFLWMAAGGPWSTSILVSAPATNPVGVQIWFYDPNGNALSMDTTSGTGNVVNSGTSLFFALNAEQPAEINLLGATSDSRTNYSSTQTGTVFAQFYCPDETTCENVLPQLIYSALPTISWSLSVPISWDVQYYYQYGLSAQWSAVGIDNGGSRRVSLVVYNQNIVSTSDPQTPTSFAIRVYDQNGDLAASGMTPPLAPIPLDSTTNYFTGDGGTWGALLSCASGCPITTPLPSGPFKIVVDGGTTPCSVEVLQVNATSATTLQVAYDADAGTDPFTVSAGALQKNRARAARGGPPPTGASLRLPQ